MLQLTACNFQKFSNTPILKTYKYDFSPYGDIILRNENYTDVKFATELSDSERKEYGFWQNYSGGGILYENYIFKEESIIEENNLKYVIKRYDASANEIEIFNGNDFGVDGKSEILYIKDNNLFFRYGQQYGTEGSKSYIFKVSDCTSENYQITQICFIDSNDVISLPDSNTILFTEEKDLKEDLHKLYSLNMNTGKINEVNFANDYILNYSKKIHKIEGCFDNTILVSAYNENGWNTEVLSINSPTIGGIDFYAVDFEKKSCNLLCKNGVYGTDFKIVNGVFYHQHKSNDSERKSYFAKTKIGGQTLCERIGKSERTETWGSIDNAYISGNLEIYTYNNLDNDTYQIICNEKADNCTSAYQSVHKPTISCVDDKVFMILNGKVIYTDSNHVGKWYDSGVEFEYFKSEYGYHQFKLYSVGKDFYCTYINYILGTAKNETLNKNYITKKIDVNFKNSLLVEDNPLFYPNLTIIKPSGIENKVEIIAKDNVTDYHANNINNAYELYPQENRPVQLEYNPEGKYKTISLNIGTLYNTNPECIGHFEIYADDDLVYQSESIMLTTQTQEIDVDINYADTVVIKGVSDKDKHYEMDVITMQLFISQPKFHNLNKLPGKCIYNYFDLTDEEILNLVEEKIAESSEDISSNYQLEIDPIADKKYVNVWQYENSSSESLICTYTINKTTKKCLLK